MANGGLQTLLVLVILFAGGAALVAHFVLKLSTAGVITAGVVGGSFAVAAVVVNAINKRK